MGAVGGHGVFASMAFILVLYILLVIVSRPFY